MWHSRRLYQSLAVAGGCAGASSFSSAEAYSVTYSPHTTGWTPLPSMPHAAWHATACVLNGRLFVAGGVVSSQLQMWAGTECRVLANLPDKRYGAAGAAHDGRFMVISRAVDSTRVPPHP